MNQTLLGADALRQLEPVPSPVYYVSIIGHREKRYVLMESLQALTALGMFILAMVASQKLVEIEHRRDPNW